MNKFVIMFLFFTLICKSQISINSDYVNMKNTINSYIKNTTYFKILSDHKLDPKFYITNLSSNLKETIKSDSLKKMVLLKDGVYAFYIKDVRYSFTHFYVKDKGNVKVFESINCPNDNFKINQVINYIKNKIRNNDDLIDNIYNYSKYVKYQKVDPQSKLNCSSE